jgi:hypothetical protein
VGWGISVNPAWARTLIALLPPIINGTHYCFNSYNPVPVGADKAWALPISGEGDTSGGSIFANEIDVGFRTRKSRRNEQTRQSGVRDAVGR